MLLAFAAGVYIPLGVRRGKMQGCYNFRGLALNVVVEVTVKLGGALLFLHYRMGVTGVMTAILLSIVAAYLVATPGAEYRATRGLIKIAPFGEGMQAVLYFIGQVILSNLDILLVKHFFPPPEAGIYAAIALVGRVVFMLSWSVVSSMFPVSASHTHRQGGRSVLYTGLLLVGTVTSVFIAVVALAPQAVWTMLLGKPFLLGTASFSTLLTEYAVMTGIYCIAVVVMMYEISRRIGTAGWVQLGASILLTGAIWRYHGSLSQVILVQLLVMCGLLVVVTTPLLREQDESGLSPASSKPLQLLRSVPEEEIVAEFLRGEFYHSEFDPYRRDPQEAEPGRSAAWTTSTRARGWRISSCSSSPRLAAHLGSRPSAARSSGRGASSNCWMRTIPTAERLVLVCDNLNTHTGGALYEAFPAAEARRLWERLEVQSYSQARQLVEHGRDGD